MVEKPPVETSMRTNQICEHQVSGKNAEDAGFQAKLTHLTRYHAVLEIYDLSAVLRVSESLEDFKIAVADETIYAGRAVVASLIHTSDRLVCEIKLAEGGFRINAGSPVGNLAVTSCEFEDFLSQWQKVYRVGPEFKVVVADMQVFLLDLRHWLGQLELGGFAGENARGNTAGVDTVRSLCESVAQAFNPLHERFEEISRKIEPEWRPMHEDFTKRQLHPLTLCSPFAQRTYFKPLGYAGDHEMVNMILGEPLQGSSLYAKALNSWFLDQWPARAHRNRIAYLTDKLREESLRGHRRGKPVRVLNVGCGPAHEILRFLAAEELSDHAALTLLDFNEETVAQTRRNLEASRRRFRRGTSIEVIKKSVHQLLKEGSRTSPPGGRPQFDFVYCAGLFDYLTDRTCQQLASIFYDWLAPDGLIVLTNVADYGPFRYMLEFLLDWNLIYRDNRHARVLIPDRANPEDCRILRDATGVNMLVEIRKPSHA